MKIIVKVKGQQPNNPDKGNLLPLFYDNWNPVKAADFPNNGYIYVRQGFENLKDDIFYNINEEDLREDNRFEGGNDDPNLSKKFVYLNVKDPEQLEFHKLMPIYSIDFDFKNKKLLSTSKVTYKPFFLKKSTGGIIGPFERNGNELTPFRFKDYDDTFVSNSFKEFLDTYSQYGEDFVFEIKIEDARNFILKDSNNNEYLTSFQDFIQKSIANPIYYSPNSKLINWIKDRIQSKIPDISKVNDEIKQLIENSFYDVDKLKYKAYKEYIQSLGQEHEARQELADLVKVNLTDTEAPRLEKENGDLKEKIKVKDDEIQSLRGENEELKSKVLDLIDSTDKINNINTVTILTDEEIRAFPILASKLSANKEDIEKVLGINKSILDLQIEEGVLKKTNEQLRTDIQKLDKEFSEKEDKVVKLKDELAGSLTAFKEQSATHITKLFENKLYGDLLNGIVPTLKSDISDIVIPPLNIIETSSKFGKAEEYINEIKERLKKQGRELAFNDVANLIITIQQSFITIIAGASGVGKTSLVEKLAKSYGLNEDFGYLEIACARGWNSSKDLIGFFNPLTNQFQPSKTKLKEALEKSSKYPNSPYIILLDEANLSPIEHYWSDFIKPADTDYARSIKISDSAEIQFGNGFRFIATINYDHTTEPLSNRLIDRAAIIQLQKGILGKNEDFRIEEIFNFDSSVNLFKKTKKWEYDGGVIKDVKDRIKRHLEDRGIIVSNRKDLMIDRYCEVATGLLEDGNIYTALDYAVSQHILPLINGRGEKFEKTLDDIRRVLNDKGMEKSEKLIAKIIERGKELMDFKYIYY